MEFISGILSNFFSSEYLMGAVRTIVLTLISQCLAVILGLILELLRRTKKPITVKFVNFYIWLFRGIPVLVQLIFVYTALPQVGIKFDNFTSALIALTLNEAAYMAEIIRSGFDSVDGGQQKAAKMLGLSKTEIMKKITLPQALQVIVPPTANQFNGMLKTSALASVVGYSDLLLTAQQIASANFEYMSALTAAVIYYLIFTTIFTYVQKKAEQKFNYLQ